MKLLHFDLDRWQEIMVTITRNKTRSLLTAFGVFWGIFMLVALMGGGNGLRSLLSSTFAGFASNATIVFSGNTTMPYKGFSKDRRWSFENMDIERIRQSVKGVEVVTPVIGKWGSAIVYGDYTFTASLNGRYPNYLEVESYPLLYGRYINNLDIHEERKVCVIGNKVYTTLFPHGGDPCGLFIKAAGVYYRIVGVGKSGSGEGIQINGTANESVVIPFTTMQKAYNMGNYVDYISVVAKKGYTTTDLQEEIGPVIRRAHLIHPDDKQALQFLNTSALFSIVDSLFSGIDKLIWMIGLGTLLAGAIGVSNIMMVTVKERTTEFGIRRAIGARPRDILVQILSESMVLTLIAGLAGISFAVLLLNATNILVHAANPDLVTNFLISFGTAVGSAFLLLFLGVLAGLAPAFRAMAIKPIDAIRDE